MKRNTRRIVSFALALTACANMLLVNPSGRMLTDTVLTAYAKDSEPKTAEFGINKTYLKLNQKLVVNNPDKAALTFYKCDPIMPAGETECAEARDPKDESGWEEISGTENGLTLTSDLCEKWIIVKAGEKVDYVYFSKLPVVYIDSNGEELPKLKEEKGKKVACDMFLQSNEETKKGAALYNGTVTISGRGNTTWSWDKKPYKIKLDSKTDLFGFGKSKKYVLLANYLDESLLRNNTAAGLSKELGLTTMETTWVDVIINGKYAGNYQLGEQVGAEEARVDIFDWEKECEKAADAIAEAIANENGWLYTNADNKVQVKEEHADEYDALIADFETQMVEDMSWLTTGKFVHKEADGAQTTYTVSDYYEYSKDFSGGFLFESSQEFDEASEFATEHNLKIMMKTPEFLATTDDGDPATEDLWTNAKQIWQDFEDAYRSPDGCNSKGQHYTELADLDSMVSYWLVQEILGNNDARYKSRYIYKAQGGKLTFGPPWDFDTGLGSSLVTEAWENGMTPDSPNWATGWKVSNFDHLIDTDYSGDDELEKIRNNQTGQNFYTEFLDDPLFCVKATEKYWQIRPYLEELIKEGGVLNQNSDYLAESGHVDEQLWRRSAGEFNTEWNLYARGYYNDTALFIRYLRERIAWLDAQFTTIYTLSDSRTDVASASPYKRSKNTFSFEVTSSLMADSSENAPAMCAVPNGNDVDMKISTSNDNIAHLTVYVNGIKLKTYEVDAVSNSVDDVTIPADMLYNKDGAKNVITVRSVDDRMAEPLTDYTAFTQTDSFFDETNGTLIVRGVVENNVNGMGYGDGMVLPDGVDKGDIQKIVFTKGSVLPEQSDYLFYGFDALKEVSFENCDASNVENVRYMFCECNKLERISFGSSFDTSQIIDMQGVFSGCSALESLDLSSFDTSNVTNMSEMFYGCSVLKSLDLSSFDTSNVTKINNMFDGCTVLESVDLSSFDTSDVTEMWDVFFGCKALKSLDLSSFDTSNVQNISGMFIDCSELKSITVSNSWSMPALENSDDMFSGCEKLTGGNGTVFSESHKDDEYARIDSESAPGYFTAVQKMAEGTVGVSLTLQSDLGLNFFFNEAGPADLSDYKIRISGKCEENGKLLPLTEKEGQFCVSANVSANHMDEVITAYFYKNHELLGKAEYSVSQYLENAKAPTAWSAEKTKAFSDLIGTMKDYGEVSRLYFTGGDLSAKAESLTEDADQINAAQPSFTAEEAPLSLVLNSRLASRIYINGLKEGDTATVKIGKSSKSKKLTAMKGENGIFFEVTDLMPTQLNEKITLTYKDKNKIEHTFTYTPLSWAYRMLNKESGAKNIAMAKVLSIYAADAAAFANL